MQLLQIGLGIVFLFIVSLYLSKRNFSILNLVYSGFSMITILCKFVYPYQSPCAITIRLQSEMTTNLERFIITYFSVPLAIKAIVIKPWFYDILGFLVFLTSFLTVVETLPNCTSAHCLKHK